MKVFKIAAVAMCAIMITATSCREKTEKEKLIDEMEANGAEIKEKRDGDEYKLKMETEDKEVKIKEEDGETKIKIDSDSK